MNYNRDADLINEVIKQASDQKEALMLEQLNDFISRGLIVVETGPFSFFYEYDSYKLVIRQTVKLVLKDKEYILQLEEENKKLKSALETVNTTLQNLKSGLN